MARKYERHKWKGREYRSKFEVDFAKRLDKSRKQLGKFKVSYEADTLDYVVPSPTRKYYPDFRIQTPTRVFYIETKGRFTAQDRRKMLLVKEQNPDVTIYLVFQSDNKLYRGSPTRYSEWAEKNGFEWSINEIKPEWFSG